MLAIAESANRTRSEIINARNRSTKKPNNVLFLASFKMHKDSDMDIQGIIA